MPARLQRIELANQLNSSAPKIYKWFFDTKRRIELDEREARDMGLETDMVSNAHLSKTVRE